MSEHIEMTDSQTTVTVHNVALTPVEFNSQRVVTLAMIDRVHQRPEGTAGRNFRENRDRFVQGEDFYLVDFFSKQRTSAVWN